MVVPASVAPRLEFRPWNCEPRSIHHDLRPRTIEERIVALLLAYTDPATGINITTTLAHLADFCRCTADDICSIMQTWQHDKDRVRPPFKERMWGSQCGYLFDVEFVRSRYTWATWAVEAKLRKLTPFERRSLRLPTEVMNGYAEWWHRICTDRKTQIRYASSVVSDVDASIMFGIHVGILRSLIARRRIPAVRHDRKMYILTPFFQTRYRDLSSPPWYLDRRLRGWFGGGSVPLKVDASIAAFDLVGKQMIDTLTDGDLTCIYKHAHKAKADDPPRATMIELLEVLHEMRSDAKRILLPEIVLPARALRAPRPKKNTKKQKEQEQQKAITSTVPTVSEDQLPLFAP
jgi:hypothetical protein